MRRAIKRIEMRGYSPNYGHHVAYARPPGRLHRAVPSHKDRQVALRRPVAVAEEWLHEDGRGFSFGRMDMARHGAAALLVLSLRAFHLLRTSALESTLSMILK